MKNIIIILFLILSFTGNIYSQAFTSDAVNSVSINLDLFADLADLEYDDSPYAGRTNIGNILLPYVRIDTKPVVLNVGGWYRHIFVQFDDDESPEKMYPFISAVFTPWKDSEFTIGNFMNLAELPNTIYNEFLFFEERPVSSGLKFDVEKKDLMLNAYIDWIERDTEDHPEEFITGLVWKHELADWFYYAFFTHYHHRGGQLSKDSHAVRIEQDTVYSPAIGITLGGFYLESEYYLSSFSQNFGDSIYGHAVSGTLGYNSGALDVSYMCFYNKDYYHKDAHIFYLKKDNLLNRIRMDYNFFKFQDAVDCMFTINLYGIDPPGIDFRLFAKINLTLLGYGSGDADTEGGRESGLSNPDQI